MVSHEEKMSEVIRMQEGEINQLREQLKTLQRQQQAQQQQMQQQQMQQQQMQQQQMQQQQFQFSMTPSDIIGQFRRLKPLDEKHNARSFINAVEANLLLCGGNEALAGFCVGIVANEKVLGKAGRRVRELQNNPSWDEIKSKILQEFRPATTYAEVFNHCRMVKVRNLSELFEIFEDCKYRINDIYLADKLKPGIYKPENVDRDLVDILLEKIDGPIRAHIGESETLTNIIDKYTKLKLLDDSRAIAFDHRVGSQNKQKPNNKPFIRARTNNNCQTLNRHWPNSNFYHNNHFRSTNKNFVTDNGQQRSGNFRCSDIGTNYYNNNRNPTVQSSGNFYSKSGQTKNSGRGGQRRQSGFDSQEPEPMDIGNLNETADVNFLVAPPSQGYQ